MTTATARLEQYLAAHGNKTGAQLCQAVGLTESEFVTAVGDSMRINWEGSWPPDDLQLAYYLNEPPKQEPRPVKRVRPRALAWTYAPVPRAIFRDPDLSMAAKMAGCALADALNLNGHNAARVIKVSYDAIAARMGANRDTAQSGISQLVEAGWIIKTSGRGHGPNSYRFTAKAKGEL